jgi:glycosyltransferase involved in cell wall biosynthesis
MDKITYCITLADEFEEIQKLLESLIVAKRRTDNILILVDTNKCTQEIEDYLIKMCDNHKITVCFEIFKGNFADWKNLFWDIDILNLSLGDYLFFIDADEVPNPELVEHLPYIIEINPEVDVFGVPRINFVEGITDEYIQQMGWRKDNQNRINYGDYQYRICKNKPNIRWKGSIHEVLSGWDLRVELPMDDVYDLLHIKTFEKQKSQNEFYKNLLKS